MSPEECEEQYLALAEKIFQPKRGKYSGLRLADFLKANGKFDSAILEEALKEVIKEKLGDENTPLMDYQPTDRGCRV